MYLLVRVKNVMSLKVWENLGLPKKISKSPYVGLFLVNRAKSNFSIRIPLYANLGFHKKMLFSQICSNGHMRAKRAARASEWAWCSPRKSSKPSKASRASEPGAVFANQVNQANQSWSVRAKQASRGKYSLRILSKLACQTWSVRGELLEPSTVFENQPNEQNKVNEKQGKQICATLQQTTTPLAYWSWRKEGRDPKSCFKFA